ncbi:hypothetical protein D3C84_582680 [compost metagenome]
MFAVPAQVGQKRLKLPGNNLVTASQQITQAAFIQIGRLAIGATHCCDTQPGGVTGTGQCHIEQTHFLAQTLVVGFFIRHPGCLGLSQFDAQLAVIVAMEHRWRLAATIEFSRVANEWQQNQWILQPLGFVDGDDFNQIGIAF